MAFREGPNFGGDCFFLLKQHSPNFEIANTWDHGALHYCSAFVVFDISHPYRFLEGNLFREALLLKIAYCIVVGVREEMFDWRSGFDVVFQVRHEMRAVTFDLLIGRDGAEDYFSKLAAVERSICDASEQCQRAPLNGRVRVYPTTSSGFLTIAIERWVRS